MRTFFINFLKGLVIGGYIPLMFYLLNNHRLAYLISMPVFALVVLRMFWKK